MGTGKIILLLRSPHERSLSGITNLLLFAASIFLCIQPAFHDFHDLVESYVLGSPVHLEISHPGDCGFRSAEHPPSFPAEYFPASRLFSMRIPQGRLTAAVPPFFLLTEILPCFAVEKTFFLASSIRRPCFALPHSEGQEARSFQK